MWPTRRPPSKSNLDIFLQLSSPVVPIHFCTQGSGSSSSTSVAACEGVRKPRILLEDVWKSLEECSSYGLKVPLTNEHRFESKIDHHYVPSLSAMQIFTKHPFNDFGDDSWTRSSVVGSDGAEKRSHNPNPNSNYRHSFLTPERLGHLYFQFNETTRPHERAPFFLKMQELARQHSGLSSLTSSDLTQYSWISIAWYPIYPILATNCPADLKASFLTYHSLTPTFPDTLVEGDKVLNVIGETSDPTVVLSPFASVTYKAFATWIRPWTSDTQKVERNEIAANSWVDTLDFKHDDLRFFMSQRFYGRRW